MRVLVVSAFYPPVAFGGYEVECSGVAEHLAERYEVTVLTSAAGPLAAEDGKMPVGSKGGKAPGKPEGGKAPVEPEDGKVPVRRELARLTPDARGAVRAPLASLHAATLARALLQDPPDLVYCWNGSSIPQAALRVIADSGVPLAFRVCEHWFGALFAGDQYMRELLPRRRGPARAAWALGCRALNRAPALRLAPEASLRAAISWNSEAIRRMVSTPAFVEPALERVGHSVPRHGDLYAAVERAPAPEPEVVFLGRVTPYKGLSVAIQALALLRDEHGIDARLVVVGPEDEGHGAELRREAERLGLAASVSWRGQASPQEAAGALARAHALIVPSVWQEPFPLVTIEGALARVPLVASDVGGIGEGMCHEEHALLFAGGDARGAAQALARTLQEPEETAARVQRAHARAQEFRIGPYLEAQEAFVLDAHRALTGER